MIRRPTPDDAGALAACHVACWREAYADVLSAELLAALDVDARTQSWGRALANTEGYAVAEVDGDVVGFAGVRSSTDDPAPRERELWGLYLRAAHHGRGSGQALLDAVLGDDPASLWVAEKNPRAHAFYRRNGFTPDGVRTTVPAWENLTIVRLLR